MAVSSTPAARPIWTTVVAIVVAAAAMVATLPGRTHGLGLVTEPLLADLGLGRVPFAALNLWATLLGALFCIPVGWLLDRIGVRPVLAAITLALGAVVVGMARWPAGDGWTISLPAPELFQGSVIEWVAVPGPLFVLVLLTRGLGQSALSVASLALIGRVGGPKPGLVIGVYSTLVAAGFMAAFLGIKEALDGGDLGWRDVWAGIGYAVAAGGLLAALVVRTPAKDGPDSCGSARPEGGATLLQALLTPAFWLFALAVSFYGLVAAGQSLFGQSILAERQFEPSVFRTITAISPLVGLAANLTTGLLATHVRLGRLLAVAMLLLGTALASFPFLTTLVEVYAYAAVLGVAGGMITTIFFGVWRKAYGTAHLGQIQGAAQLLTVLASALGPLLLAGGLRASGSYAPVIQGFAVVSAVFAVAAWFTPLPHRDPTGEAR